MQLFVTPAVFTVGGHVADFVAPVGRVGGCASRLVELITPDQAPAGGARIGGAIILELHRDGVAAVGAVEPESQGLAARPVLTDGEIAAKATRATSDDGLASEGCARQRELLGITIVAGFIGPEVENEVDVAVTFKVLLMTLGAAVLLITVRFRGVTKANRVVVN